MKNELIAALLFTEMLRHLLQLAHRFEVGAKHKNIADGKAGSIVSAQKVGAAWKECISHLRQSFEALHAGSSVQAA